MGYLRPILKEHYFVLEKTFAILRTILPKGLQQIDLFSPEGAFAWPFLHPLSLFLITAVVAIPATAWPAGERSSGGLDLILASPQSRSSLLSAVFRFLLLCALVAALAPLLGSFLGASVCGESNLLPWATYCFIAVNSWALGAFFGSMALMISVLSEDRAQAGLRYGACVVLCFLIDVFGGMHPKGNWIRNLGPFGRFDPYGALRTTDALWIDIPVLFGTALALFALSLWFGNRRKRA
jgi:ABC-type transport system involved in multi-copper enzyme maturation permease subunit